jgi:hypothetical protein
MTGLKQHWCSLEKNLNAANYKGWHSITWNRQSGGYTAIWFTDRSSRVFHFKKDEFSGARAILPNVLRLWLKD